MSRVSGAFAMLDAGDGAPPPSGMYRNRKLLDLAHRITFCQNCGTHVHEGCEPGHSNLSEHGKGFRLKAHDCFFAALCSRCHGWLDNSGGLGKDPTGRYTSSRDDKREMFRRAMDSTMLLLWQLELVRVAP